MGEKTYRCDLHIHSCLSPCADLLMTPGNIIQQALKLGLDCIAITDHNTAGNVAVAMELGKQYGLTIIPGMEVETREEVHLLCFFPVLEKLLAWDRVVADNLPQKENAEEHIGYQLLTDLADQYAAKDHRLLATATYLSVDEVVTTVNRLGGMVVPSHVDRRVNSILSQLGFIPPDLGIRVIEITRHSNLEQFFGENPHAKGYSYITGSDSHYLTDLGRCGQGQVGFPLIKEMAWLMPG